MLISLNLQRFISDELLGVIRLARYVRGCGPILQKVIKDLAGIVTGGKIFLQAFRDS